MGENPTFVALLSRHSNAGLSESEDDSKHPEVHRESQEAYRGGLGSRGIDCALSESIACAA
jgi:hypothetical protein